MMNINQIKNEIQHSIRQAFEKNRNKISEIPTRGVFGMDIEHELMEILKDECGLEDKRDIYYWGYILTSMAPEIRTKYFNSDD